MIRPGEAGGVVRCLGGTVLQTDQGEVAVERLAIGMVLRDADGAALRVRWVGRTRLAPSELAARPGWLPVRIAPGALDDGLPDRMLDVMADQIVPVAGGQHWAALWLVNGASITRGAGTTALDVFDLDLDPPGSPLVHGLALPGAGTVTETGGDAALLALRRHLAGRAGLPIGGLHGSLDGASHVRAAGWAYDRMAEGYAVAVEVLVNDTLRGVVVADMYRRDLEVAAIGGGRHAFLFPFSPPLDPQQRHLVRVRRAVDGFELPGSPMLVEPKSGIDEAMAQSDEPGPIRAGLQSGIALLASRLGTS